MKRTFSNPCDSFARFVLINSFSAALLAAIEQRRPQEQQQQNQEQQQQQHDHEVVAGISVDLTTRRSALAWQCCQWTGTCERCAAYFNSAIYSSVDS